MGAPVLNGPFTMPMFRNFVPRKLQPWLYIFIAVTFQLSGGLYMANLSHMVGETSLMREDLQMCLYCNLAGMAVYFPLLFRMKFRFTNKTLLTAASLGVIVCNLIAPYTTFLPLLWTLCFIEGICKIQGTFEALSTIQLWMTPKRDFTVFFPLLHIIILGSMQVSSIIATHLGYYMHWSYMHWFMAGLMLVDLLIVQGCTRHFRIVKKFPLFGIDWLGAVLWAILLLEVAYFFDYGEFYDWWNSPVMQGLAVAIVITLGFCIGRMLHIRHPYIEPEMWSYRHLLPHSDSHHAGGSLPCHRTRTRRRIPRQRDALRRDGSHAARLAHAGRCSSRQPVRLLVDARTRIQLPAPHHRRYRLAGMLPAHVLLRPFGRHSHLAALLAYTVPRFRLRHPERHVHGMSGRNHDLPPLLSGTECIQHAAHGSGRCHGRRPVRPLAVVRRIRQHGTLRSRCRPRVVQQPAFRLRPLHREFRSPDDGSQHPPDLRLDHLRLPLPAVALPALRCPRTP